MILFKKDSEPRTYVGAQGDPHEHYLIIRPEARGERSERSEFDSRTFFRKLYSQDGYGIVALYIEAFSMLWVSQCGCT